MSWEAAQDRVRGWEASGEVGVVKAEIPEIPDAVDRFFADVKSRGLADHRQAAGVAAEAIPAVVHVAGIPLAEADRRGRDHAVSQDMDRQFEPREFISQGDRVVTLGHYKGTSPGGRTFDSDFVMVFKLRDGKVTHFQEFLDVAQLNAAYQPATV